MIIHQGYPSGVARLPLSGSEEITFIMSNIVSETTLITQIYSVD